MDLDVVLLRTASAETLDRLAQVLAGPVERWLRKPAGDVVARCVARDSTRTSLHALVVADGAPGGWAGWLRYRPDPTALETTTFLAPAYWGTGMNPAVKGLQWAAAQRVGMPLVASVHTDNLRSYAALRRLWPDAPCVEVYEEYKHRRAHLFTFDRPPTPYVSWPDEIVERFAAELACITPVA